MRVDVDETPGELDARLERRKAQIIADKARTDDTVARINEAVRRKQAMRDRIIAAVNNPHTTTSVLVTIEAILEDEWTP
jgi:hypothetical protein